MDVRQHGKDAPQVQALHAIMRILSECVRAPIVTIKPWGTSELLYADTAIELHRIRVVQGGFCSKHEHRHKHNLFIWQSGGLLVQRYTATGGTNTYPLHRDSPTFWFDPSQQHRFHAHTACEALELYLTDCRGEFSCDDIFRDDIGGVWLPKCAANSSEPCPFCEGKL